MHDSSQSDPAYLCLAFTAVSCSVLQGLWPNYVKVVPSIAIAFVTYEQVKPIFIVQINLSGFLFPVLMGVAVKKACLVKQEDLMPRRVRILSIIDMQFTKIEVAAHYVSGK